MPRAAGGLSLSAESEPPESETQSTGVKTQVQIQVQTQVSSSYLSSPLHLLTGAQLLLHCCSQLMGIILKLTAI